MYVKQRKRSQLVFYIMDDLLYDLYYIKHNYDGVENLYKKAKLINKEINKEHV